MNEYKKRVIDDQLKEKLECKGAVLIERPKWCGKTTAAEQAAKSILYLSNPRYLKQNLLLKGDTPQLIDEWQIAPKLWDAIRFEVD